MEGVTVSIEERFHTKYVKTMDGCWEWTGPTYGGYGRLAVGHAYERAHRVSYALAIGPIPDGLEIDHLCRNRACVNPDHLEAVEHRENVLRGEGPAARHAVQTECHRGHPFDAANTYMRPDHRGRECRACGRERVRQYDARKKDR